MALLSCWAMSGCQQSRAPRTISVTTLESMSANIPIERQRFLVSDPRELTRTCPILGERVILIQARNAAEWELIRPALPDVSLRPDFSRGSVIGVASCAGTPVGGEWPVALRSVRVCQGAGIVRADFAAGTYLPDEATFAEVAFVEGLGTALIVEINGERFFPN